MENPPSFLLVALSAVLPLAMACSEPTAVIGRWPCTESPWTGGDATGPAPMPWATGFESGFCDYRPPDGYCYRADAAAYRIVTSPVHSGHYAAAFTIIGDADAAVSGVQTRCVRQGTLPPAAYYGAWYYVPEVQTNTGIWNLLYWVTGPAQGTELHGLWSLALVNDDSGGLRLGMYDHLREAWPQFNGLPPIPIGAWFQLEVYLKRAADATGEVTVYQDGVEGLHLTGLITDDSQWGQWYVGNLADHLQPPESTVYVDDVTLRETR